LRFESSASRRARSACTDGTATVAVGRNLVALATAGPFFAARSEEHLHPSVGKHDRADVAAFNNAAAVGGHQAR